MTERHLRGFIFTNLPLNFILMRSGIRPCIGKVFGQKCWITAKKFCMAASLVTMLPVIAVFFTAQRLFIDGITLTGLKG